MSVAEPPVAAGQSRALTLRVISGLIVGPVLVGVAYLGGWIYAVLIVVACAIAAWETFCMLRAGGHRPLVLILGGLAILLPAAAFGEQIALIPGGLGLDVVVVATIGGLFLLLQRGRLDGALDDWALSLALGLYIGGLMQFFAPLRWRADGTFWVVALLLCSWMCDSAAYFVGGAWGRRRLAPLVSPKKSVEGAIAGVVAAGILGGVIGAVGQHPIVLLVGFGLWIALATILGDLAESLIKRQTGVKDSGVLMPGHGGLLDRMDSILFCAPAAALYVGCAGLLR